MEHTSPGGEPSPVRSYCGGRVLHHTLPVVEPGPRSVALERKRVQLPKGALEVLHNNPDPIRFLAYLELKAGMDRGHHVHRLKEESFYLISGHVTMGVEALDTGESHQLDVQPGDLVQIFPGIAHAVRVHEAGHAVEFSREPVGTDDTRPHTVPIPLRPS